MDRKPATSGKILRKTLEENSIPKNTSRGEARIEASRRILQRLVLGESLKELGKKWDVSQQAMDHHRTEDEKRPEIAKLIARNRQLRNGKLSTATTVIDSANELLTGAGMPATSLLERKQRTAEAVLKLRWRMGLPVNEGTMQSTPLLKMIRNRLIRAHGSYPAAVQTILQVPYAKVRKQEQGQGLGSQFKTIQERDATMRERYQTEPLTRAEAAKEFGLKEGNTARILKGFRKNPEAAKLAKEKARESRFEGIEKRNARIRADYQTGKYKRRELAQLHGLKINNLHFILKGTKKPKKPKLK